MISGIHNQDRGKYYPAELKAEADNTYRDLDYPGYHKNKRQIHRFDITLGNHALRAQPGLVGYLLADNKLICRLY